MSLSTLPVVVLDTLLLKLDLASLIALSSTCRTLHVESNRVIYRQPAFQWLRCGSLQHTFDVHDGHTARLEQSLSQNPFNAQFLQKHRSLNVKLLKAIWSDSPLQLSQLHITSQWFSSSCGQEVVECVNSKHKDINVREIFVNGPQDGRFRGLLDMLHTFQGLEVLHIHCAFSWGYYISPDALITQLNSPQLKQLHLSSSDLVIALGDILPNLKVLTMNQYDIPYFNGDEARYYSSDEKWARLQALMNREIYFAITIGLYHSLTTLTLLPFVFRYAELNRLNPDPMVKWLLNSQRFLQKNRQLRICELPPRYRNNTLKILKCLNFEEDLKLAMTLDTFDTPTLADILPNTVSYLDIFVPEDIQVEPAIVPELVRSLRRLRTISIHLSGKIIGSRRFECNATCFATSWDGKFPHING
jgi:hypothetical protein